MSCRDLPYSVSGTLFGARGAIRLGPFYVTGRYLKGTTGAVSDSLPSRDITLWTVGGGLLLAGTVRVDVESWFREGSSILGDQRFAGWRVGLGFQGDLIPDVVDARFLAHYSPGPSTSQPSETASLAWDGSVEIGVKPPHLPLRLWFSYDLQRLNFSATSGPANAAPLEERRFSGITLGLGLQL